MEENRNVNNVPAEGNEDSINFSIHDLIQMVIGNWFWFLLSTVVCLSCALFYIYTAPKVYNRTATILIKDGKKGSETDIAAFGDLLGATARRNVDNEIIVLKSRNLMTEVVRRLNLHVNYVVKHGLRTENLYRRSPIDVTFIDDNERQALAFELTPVDNEKFSLTKFVNRTSADSDKDKDSEIYEVEMTGRFNDTITTPCGLLVVTPTLYMSDDYFGDPISVSKQIVSSMASGYNKRIAIELVEKQANAISISLDDNIPRRAEDVINTLIARYNDESINDKNRIADYTADFIDKRLRIIGSELDAVDRKISTYKKDNEMYDITAQATQSLTESSQFKTAGLSVENQISMAQYIRDYLLNDTKLRDLIPANVAITNVSISDQIKNYNELMLRRDKLAGNASSNSPVIQDFDSELAALRRAIIASLQSHISTLEIQLNNIRREESLARTRIASATRQSTELLDNTRQQRIKEELYLYLLNKREENELTKAIADNNARIIDPAYGSSTPVAPRSVIILFIALLFGLATPFGIIYLMEILDTTIRGRKDIEDKLSIPFLGDIPEYHGSTRQGSVVVRDNGRDSVSEAFRLIRSNLGFMSVKSGKLQIIMVTSSDPHAGKTFVTTNLAMTLALADKKVVIVDLDLRRRTLSKQMGQRDNRNGVSGYISGTIANLNDIVFQSGLHENLDIIFAGRQPPNPAEMLLSEKFDEFMADLRKRYDYVVIDSVPAMAVADALITDRLADLTIYVIREGLLDRRQLPDIEKLYREKKFHNMSIVLNGSTGGARRGYGYGYGYGDSYGYRDTHKKHK